MAKPLFESVVGYRRSVAISIGSEISLTWNMMYVSTRGLLPPSTRRRDPSPKFDSGSSSVTIASANGVIVTMTGVWVGVAVCDGMTVVDGVADEACPNAVGVGVKNPKNGVVVGVGVCGPTIVRVGTI